MSDLTIKPPGVIPGGLIERVEQKLDECMTIFPQVDRPYVVYDLRGRHAGYANRRRIRLNVDLLNDPRYVDSMIDDTLVHEFAHVVVYQLSPGSKAHGEQWKRVMRTLGLEPVRCHDYDVEPVRVHSTPYAHWCACPEPHYTTARVHKRIMAGISYTCRKCKTVLR